MLGWARDGSIVTDQLEALPGQFQEEGDIGAIQSTLFPPLFPLKTKGATKTIRNCPKTTLFWVRCPT